MPDFLVPSLLLFLVGLVAGALNVIAGGGSLLTLPMMIFLGLPPTVANGTNRFAILVQNVGASWSFHRRKLISKDWLLFAVPPALAGVVLGTLAAVRVGDLAFQRTLAVVLVCAAVWSVWRPITPPAEGEEPPPSGSKKLIFAFCFFLVGVYGGFIQAGVGFIVLAVTSAGGLNLIRGNAVKVPLILAFTVVALALFAWNGLVDWAMAFALAGGNFLGALAGVRMQILKGHRWIRNVVTVTTVIFAIRLLFGG